LQHQDSLPLLNPSCQQEHKQTTNGTPPSQHTGVRDAAVSLLALHPPRSLAALIAFTLYDYTLTCNQAAVMLWHSHACKVQLSSESWRLLLLLLLG
jgi:hypothetical protein